MDNKSHKESRFKRIMRFRIWRFSKNMRLPDKAAHINEWANLNRKQFFKLVVGVLGGIALLSLISSVLTIHNMRNRSPQAAVEEAGDIIGGSQLMENIKGLHEIHSNNSQIKDEMSKFVDRGVELKNELDSLLALPVKTRADSLRIVQVYNNLETIVKFLNGGEDEEAKP